MVTESMEYECLEDALRYAFDDCLELREKIKGKKKKRVGKLDNKLKRSRKGRERRVRNK